MQVMTSRQLAVGGAVIFSLPIIAGFLPIIGAQLFVPRDEVSAYILKGFQSSSLASHSPIIAGAMYLVAVSATITLAACIASLSFSIYLLLLGSRGLEERGRTIILGIASIIPVVFALLAITISGLVDDIITHMLFVKTGVIEISRPYTFDWDGKILGFLVYTAFAEASLAASLATVMPNQFAIQRSLDAPASRKQADQKTDGADPTRDASSDTRTTILFLTAAVLVSAMITAKFRFDVGLAAVGPAPNPYYTEYKILSSSIMTYWATVLSMCLAFIYLTGTIATSVFLEGKPIFVPKNPLALDEENLMRLFRCAAIVSPPVINGLIQAFAGGAAG